MNKKIYRKQTAQAMIEYALGIGCVAAVCMVLLASLGHISAHVIWQIGTAVKSPDQANHPEPSINLSAQPWVLK